MRSDSTNFPNQLTSPIKFHQLARRAKNECKERRQKKFTYPCNSCPLEILLGMVSSFWGKMEKEKKCSYISICLSIYSFRFYGPQLHTMPLVTIRVQFPSDKRRILEAFTSFLCRMLKFAIIKQSKIIKKKARQNNEKKARYSIANGIAVGGFNFQTSKIKILPAT